MSGTSHPQTGTSLSPSAPRLATSAARSWQYQRYFPLTRLGIGDDQSLLPGSINIDMIKPTPSCQESCNVCYDIQNFCRQAIANRRTDRIANWSADLKFIRA
jgi:hypothetical protein